MFENKLQKDVQYQFDLCKLLALDVSAMIDQQSLFLFVRNFINYSYTPTCDYNI